MLSAKTRLAVTAALFLGWLGWLTYLVAQSRDPVVLSRPQFLVSNLHVIASLTGNGGPELAVTVKEVVWPKDAPEKASAQIKVVNLTGLAAEQGWRGPDDYILPLTRWKDGMYSVTLIPKSPGYSPTILPRIYQATDSARRQLAQLSPDK